MRADNSTTTSAPAIPTKTNSYTVSLSLHHQSPSPNTVDNNSVVTTAALTLLTVTWFSRPTTTITHQPAFTKAELDLNQRQRSQWINTPSTTSSLRELTGVMARPCR